MTLLNDLYDNYGQSPWIDNIRREWLADGTLTRLVEQGVRGVTSNPAIFAKALSTSTAYDSYLASLSAVDPEVIFERLAVEDVRDACDVLASVYQSSTLDFDHGVRRYADGFVSLEVSPRLAHDTTATIEAAQRLASAVQRENLMVKIPATVEGLPAVSAVLAAGINVNVTLMFSLERYGEVITAWLNGLEGAVRNGHDIRRLASVASFFVSRVDAAVDPMLPTDDQRRGKTAIAQVAAAYELYLLRTSEDRTQRLLAQGAQVQRPLWASTSPKDPLYDDLLYVDGIVGDESVNTMPDATLATTLKRGDFKKSLLVDSAIRASTSSALQELPSSVVLEEVTTRLEIDGVASFVTSYEELLGTVAKKLSGIF
jgi:transaldolase